MNQLTDNGLIRLWKTGADYLAHSSGDDEFIEDVSDNTCMYNESCTVILSYCLHSCMDNFLQFSSYLTEPGEYGLSKDLDVALWLDYREFHKEPSLPDVYNFVLVNSQLRNQFDIFRKAEVKPSHSLVPVAELLRFYCLSQCPQLLDCSKVVKFGKTYLELHKSQIDKLVMWVDETRDAYYGIEGEKIFAKAAQIMLTDHELSLIHI